MVKGRDRKKGRFEMEVKNRERLGQNEAKNEDRDETREDRGTQDWAGTGQETGGWSTGDEPGWGENTEVRGWESGQTGIGLALRA